MFEIENKNEKSIYVSLHMEQVYCELQQSIKQEQSIGCFNKDSVGISCIENLQKILCPNEKEDYILVVDFTNIALIEPNQSVRFKGWLQQWKLVKVYNCRLKDQKQCQEYTSYQVSERGYMKEFQNHGKEYIKEIRHSQQGYMTQTGTILDVYIDIKKMVEDTVELFRWCYMLVYMLNENATYKRKYKSGKNAVLFCHTLNGANIASTLSQMLNLDIIFVDHLGPYNKLNTINFYKDIYSPKECIVIVDMVCQGSELLRAKNIIEYLGGTVIGVAGIVRLELSDLCTKGGIESFAITFTAEEARKDLQYTIKTKLCDGQC